MRLAILPLGRPTFDVPFAEEKLTAMLAALDQSGHEIIGPRHLLFDAEQTQSAMDEIAGQNPDQLLLLQVTFTDASMATVAAAKFNIPLSIWAVTEPRDGDRLRLNSFCGLNLASHALGLRNRTFSWLYCDPLKDCQSALEELLSGSRTVRPLSAEKATVPGTQGASVMEAIKGQRIARLGDHPEGFDTCAYDPAELQNLAGVEVDALQLDALFDPANAVTHEELQQTRQLAQSKLSELDQVDQTELDKSLRLKNVLQNLRADRNYAAFAIRCWPETFTEYGGAVCGPVSMMGEDRVPCACEADVYGALTQMILQEASQQPVFLADLVDMDIDDNTGVVWHCGQAPISMCDPDFKARATIHTNRKMPLLFEFPLKSGPVTLMRISQSFGETKMILSSGEMLKREMAFTGTSGTVRFDRPVEQVLPDIMNSGLEHHMAVAYGDHRDILRSIAVAMDIPVLEI